MPISSKKGNILDSNEKFICVLCNCIETMINPDLEPQVNKIYTKFPHANIYKERKGTGQKGKPGNIDVKGNGQNERFVINILSQFYAGQNNFPNDSHDKRLIWFKKGLARISDLNHLDSIAIDQQLIEEMSSEKRWKSYLEAIDDFDKLLGLKNRKNVNIVIYESETTQQEKQSQHTESRQSESQHAESQQAQPQHHTDQPHTEQQSQEQLEQETSSVPTFFEKDEKVADTKEYIRLTNLNSDIVLTLAHFKKLNIVQHPKNKTKTTKDSVTEEEPSKEEAVTVEEPSEEEAVAEKRAKEVATIDEEQAKEEEESAKEEEESAKEEEEPTKEEEESAATKEVTKRWNQNPDWICQVSELPEKIVGWHKIFIDGKLQDELRLIDDFFEKEMEMCGDSVPIYPPQHLIFNAFSQCAFKDIKVVLIGMDPYINTGEAMGMSFSVPKGVKIPPSLQNIYKELETDIPGFVKPNHGDLTPWAKQGVLLLNTSLTVRHKKTGSHLTVWKNFTDRVIELISEKSTHPLMFLLWGLEAKRKQNLIDTKKHIILTSAHPSPLSANKGGWFGNKHFSKINSELKRLGLSEINWNMIS